MTEGSGPATPPASGEAAEILWRHPAPYLRRREKLINARVAIGLALERRPSASAAERELISFLRHEPGSDSEVAAAVWSEPAAYQWVRTLYDLIAVVVGGGDRSPAVAAYLDAVGAADPADGLERLAGDHKLFALALALRANRDVAFARPWIASLPLAIPATPLILDGEGVVQIHGVRDGHIDLGGEGGAPRAELRRSPTVSVDGCQLRLSPEAFDRPGMELAATLRAVPPGFQLEHAPLLERTLRVVARHHPDTITHARAMMRLVALKPATLGQTTNLSHSDFPGSMALSVVHDPYWLADALIHEVHHNRLFFVEELGQFFADPRDNLMLRSAWYSPWREEPRSLHGILHAIYVNLPLWHFWHDVRRAGLSPERDLLADGQLVTTALQLEIAVRQLERHARFSAFGASLFAEMAAEVRRVRATTRAMGLGPGVAATRADIDGTLRPVEPQAGGRATTVGDVLRQHLSKFDAERQCAGDEGLLAEM